ncbi:MAG: hypothetical protein U0359_00320 [Byssovorax sp.]
MIHPVDDRLLDEARRFRLLFACPDCASFDPEGQAEGEPPGRCSLGYPNAMHRDPSLTGRAEVIFCKAFELL